MRKLLITYLLRGDVLLIFDTLVTTAKLLDYKVTEGKNEFYNTTIYVVNFKKDNIKIGLTFEFGQYTVLTKINLIFQNEKIATTTLLSESHIELISKTIKEISKY